MGGDSGCRFRMMHENGRIVIEDETGKKQSYLEWVLEHTELTQEVFDHARMLLRGSGPALEEWLALAEKN